MLAGHETTANAMAWMWYLLALNPDARERMLAEVDAVLGDGRRPTLDDVAAPAVDDGVLPGGDAFVPAGLGHPAPLRERRRDRRPPDPEGLDGDHPDPRAPPRRALLARPRGLRPDPLPARERAQAHHRSAYLPFGGGRRVCIGTSFALIEATLITAMMSREFVYDLVPGHPVDAARRR